MDNTAETKAILQRMEEVRCDLDEDVQEIVEGARDLGKWRSYVRSFPWISLGAALVGGYLIVPRRVKGMQPDPHTLAELAKQSRLLAMSQLPPKGNASGRLLAFVGDLAMRGIVSYVGQEASKLIAIQAAKLQQAKSQQDNQP